ncbi:MAG: tetratricopeptide repeat protein [Planctomycetota bacterium]|nr:tetratricopeptide repeat protein [Planctomycetota bacterium]
MAKKTLFGAIALLVFFAIAELVLGLCGVRPILYDEDPHVGFSSQIPLFVETAGADGRTYMATAKNKLRFFNPQRFLRDKPDDTYRIFCMGGSTTNGRPYDDETSFCGWLRAMLPEADPSHGWELINAGGVSYASYRVAILMEELVEYEPDLFIIYTGHNEFLEKRTYAAVLETPSAVAGLQAALGRTRIYTAIKRAFRPGGHSSDRAPERFLLPGEVEAMLDDTIGPAAYYRDDAAQEQVIQHFRYNLARMVDIARSAGAQVVLIAPASNLRHCSPFKSEHRADLAVADRERCHELLRRAQEQGAAGLWRESLAILDQAATIDDRYAQLHYLRGCALWALSRPREAKSAFIRARDEDVCPLRALTPMHEAVIEVAKNRGVPLLDFVTRAERQSEHETPGETMFLDHVHPSIESHRLLALDLLSVLRGEGIARPIADWGNAEIEKITSRVMGRLDLESHGIALRNLAKVLSWAGKFEEAHALTLRATQMIPHDTEAHFHRGNTAYTLGRLDEAIEHFRQALVNKPDFVPALNNLGNVLLERGEIDEATALFERAVDVEPDYAAASNNLGRALLAQRNLVEATARFREAIRLKPDYADARVNLGGVLQLQGNRDEALSQYRRAVEQQHNHAPARHRLGSLLLTMGRIDEAIGHFREALNTEPDAFQVHNSLGNALAAKNRLDEAIGCFRRALEINADFSIARRNLGKALSARGEFESAIAEFREALRVAPDDSEAQYSLGLALTLSGKSESGLEHFEKAAHLKPEWPAALNAMAWVLATHANASVRDGAKAVAHAKRACELTQNQDPTLLDTLAAAYAAAGEYGKATAKAEAALSMAVSADNTNLAEQIRSRLELYRRGIPFREGEGPLLSTSAD